MLNDSAPSVLKTIQGFRAYVVADRVSVAAGMLSRLTQELNLVAPGMPGAPSPAKIYLIELEAYFSQLSYADTVNNYNRLFPPRPGGSGAVKSTQYAQHKAKVLSVLTRLEKFARNCQISRPTLTNSGLG